MYISSSISMRDVSGVGNQCTGCGACTQVCAKRCITMKPNNEGFYYPQIDRTICVACGRCVSVCPAIAGFSMQKPIIAYAATSQNVIDGERSSSGGIFFEAASYIIQYLHGYVCGAVLDDQLVLKHIVTNKMTDICKMQGSKYIQSRIDDCYQVIIDLLDQDTNVLFCGTPCQVEGILKVVGNRENLYTMDLVCHGVPSNVKFVEYMKKNYKLKGNVDFSFRQKNAFTNSTFSYAYKINSKYFSVPAFNDPFYQAFLEGNNYRESCYTCRFACSNRVGDITIGDCANWRAYKLPINRVLSTVLINTEKGEVLWNRISNKMLYCTANYEREKELNQQLHTPTTRKDKRDNFYSDIECCQWKELKRRYCPHRGIKERVRYFVLMHTTPRFRQNLKRFIKI